MHDSYFLNTPPTSSRPSSLSFESRLCISLSFSYSLFASSIFSYSFVSFESSIISAATSFALCLISSCFKISLCAVDILSFKVSSSILLTSIRFPMSFRCDCLFESLSFAAHILSLTFYGKILKPCIKFRELRFAHTWLKFLGFIVISGC